MSFVDPTASDRNRDLCFIDVETTGSVLGFHEIIELGAIRTAMDGSGVREKWQAKIRPRFPARITDVARAINGYTDAEWRAAQESSSHLWGSFASFCKGCIPVCHNPTFERAFISLEAGARGVQDLGLDYHWIGTESIAWPLYLKGQLPKLSLDNLCEFFGFDPEVKPHTALGGAEACRNVYIALIALSAGSMETPNRSG